MIALVRHGDDLVAEAEGEEQLGRVGHQAHDPHHGKVSTMGLLSDEEIDRRLEAVDGWRREGDEIVQDLKFEDFAAAMGFVNRVADVAEERNHHPDILSTAGTRSG